MKKRLYIFLMNNIKTILFPIFFVPLLSVALILFSEPSFISTIKLWTKEKQQESMLLKVMRKGIQEETYVEVQREILLSDRVLKLVIDKNNLLVPPDSQKPIYKILQKLGIDREEEIVEESIEERVIESLKKSIKVEILNPEVLEISVATNSPKLSYEVGVSLIEAYRTVYLEMLNQEVMHYQTFLENRLKEIDENLLVVNDQLLAFEANNPEVMISNGNFENYTLPPSLAREIGDSSPIPHLLQRLGDLQMKSNQIAINAGKNSDRLKQVNNEIAETERLLSKYKNQLTGQAKLITEYEYLKWNQLNLRKSFDYVSDEMDKILLLQGAQLKQMGAITVLDFPYQPSIKSAPKKKKILIMALFLGSFIGFSVAYLRQIFNPIILVSEDLEKITKKPSYELIFKK